MSSDKWVVRRIVGSAFDVIGDYTTIAENKPLNLSIKKDYQGYHVSEYRCDDWNRREGWKDISKSEAALLIRHSAARFHMGL